MTSRSMCFLLCNIMPNICKKQRLSSVSEFLFIHHIKDVKKKQIRKYKVIGLQIYGSDDKREIKGKRIIFS